MIDFTEEQIQRYSRHILLQDVGVEGQEKIMNARVLVVGAGGLGAPVALYLAAAGIGTIGIVDADVVDLSNLQRQVIHFTKDVGVPKVKSAEEKIKAINPDVKVETYYKFLDSSNALDIIKEYDFIVDGTDNFPVKFLINDACVMAGSPSRMEASCASTARRSPTYPARPATVVCLRNRPLWVLCPLVLRLEYWGPLLACWVRFRRQRH